MRADLTSKPHQGGSSDTYRDHSSFHDAWQRRKLKRLKSSQDKYLMFGTCKALSLQSIETDQEINRLRHTVR